MSTLPLYAPSGSFGPATLLRGLFGAAAAALLALPYALLVTWIPYVQGAVVVSAGFAAALAGLVYLAVNRGHCRSRLLGAAVGLFIGASGLAASYGWTWAHSLWNISSKNPDVLAVDLVRTIPLSRWMETRIESGWKIGRDLDLNGPVVLTVWLVEAAMVLFAALHVGKRYSGEPYCERCQGWTIEKTLVLNGHGRAAAQGPLAAGDLDALLSLPDLPPERRPEAAGTREDPVLGLKLTGAVCPKCLDSAWLTVKELRSHAYKGKVQTNEEDLVAHVTLDGSQTARLLGRTAAS
jgi:hypothetical protein